MKISIIDRSDVYICWFMKNQLQVIAASEYPL